MIGPGYIGLKAAQEALGSGYKVYVLIRNPQKKTEMQALGLVPVLGDLLKPETLEEFPLVGHVLISIAPDQHTPDDYRRVYVDGLKAALSRFSGQEKLLWISSTSVWADSGEDVDEETPAVPLTEQGRILLEAESTLNRRHPRSMILRLSGIYGPGRNRLQAFRQGIWPDPGSAAALRYLNLIHRDDAVRAIHFLLDHGQTGQIYLGTDCEPFLNRDLARWLSERLARQTQLPEFEALEPAGKRCRNRKLKVMGFEYLYPSFREGYGSLLKGENAP